mmetsp:Transcript_23953/g.30938  ORF Transcript_23953/g.30938 Transcript_23953/m.30938 type:complete len:498 (+) Transcript_23953:33-1526(+)
MSKVARRSIATAFTGGDADLSKNPIIAGAVAQLASTVDMIHYMAGDTIVQEGGDEGILYIVQEGSCGLYRSRSEEESKEENFEGKLMKGQMGGLDSLIDKNPQPFTVKAEEDCEILKINHSEFMSCVRESDELMTMLFDRMRQTPTAQTPRPRQGREVSTYDMIRVAFFDAKPYDKESFDFYNNAGDIKFKYFEEKLSEESVELADGCQVVCLFVNDECDRSILEQLKKMGIEMVTMRCAGFDRVDLEAANELGITVARVPAYSPYAVAEHAAALLQLINRKLHVAYQRVRSGNFSLSGLVGFDLYGKKCGVLGTGKIGQCFINIALGFGMEVLMYDVYKNATLEANPRCTYVELDEVFQQCDVVSIHLPLLPSTKHVVNERTLGMMKSDAILLNVSRGGLVDTEALITALKEERIGGAGLDVYENEATYFFADKSSSNIADDLLARLLSFRNCILTSHQAFLTQEALQAISQTTISNVKSFNEGKTMTDCPNSVNK